MSTPPDDEDARLRDRLRKLKAERDHSNDLYDRFGDERLGGRAHQLDAEIAAMPEHIRRADEIDTQLRTLTYLVEDYLIARTAQFLPDVDDLWATVRTLPERQTPETPAEKPVVGLLADLRSLGASEDDLRAAVERGAMLESYRNPRAARWRERTTPGTYHDYSRTLRRNIGDFLKKGGVTVHSSDQLVRLIAAWHSPDAPPAEAMTRYYRQAILSTIAVLRRLGMSEADINAIIAEVVTQQRTLK
ncbi:MAG: hypothetical protein IT319_07190 [Anaerolineae bacterium]|nr:hypothetical protein [Anaerolineae bacterium]